MGGICGWVGLTPRARPSLREEMCGALSHRGGVAWLDWSNEEPDGAGTIVADTASNSDKSLSKDWSSWSSDPAAFASRLEGGFAVAVLDRRRGRLLLVRDRLGEKPLYYVATPEGVGFASEIKALLAGGLLPDMTLRPEAVDSFLAFTYIPAPWTIFEHVQKVPAGHLVGIDLNRLAESPGESVVVQRYWAIPERGGEGATPEHCLEQLSAALERRLPADRKVAIFLSGGLDSSIVAALLARDLATAPPTFSIGFPESGLDESVHAQRVAQLVGSRHRQILLNEIDADLASRVIAQLDEPMADAATLPTWVLAREASREAPVVMTGDGADALLAGDHWFRRLRKLDRLERLPQAARALTPMVASLAGGREYRKHRQLVNMLRSPPVNRYLAIREKWTWSERLSAYHEEFAARVDPTWTPGTYLEAPIVWRTGESVDAAIRLDATHGLPEDLLMKADKMCTAHGLDSRSPFTDHRWVEWTAHLSIDHHLHGSKSKYLLKKAAESLLPRDLIWRRKHGFQTPVGRWMKGPLRDLVETAFSAERIDRQKIFSRDALGRLKSRFEAGPGTAALNGQVWQIVVFQTWWRQVFER